MEDLILRGLFLDEKEVSTLQNFPYKGKETLVLP